MPVLEVNDARCFYISSVPDGNENMRTVILVHGAGGNHLSMMNIFNYIKLKFGQTLNIVTLDLPGHFKSGVADWQKSMEYSCDDVCGEGGIKEYAETIRLLFINLRVRLSDSILLLGHSMGAQICIKYASMFPQDTAKCMLIAGCDYPETSDEFITSLENNFERTLKLFLSDALGTKSKPEIEKAFADVSRTPQEIVIADFKNVKRFGMHCGDDLNKINSGNTFFNMVYSDADRIIKSKCVEKLREKLRNSLLNKINSENHMAFLYGNRALEKELDKFLLT